MKIHHEGRGVLTIYFLILALLNGALFYLFPITIFQYIILVACIVLYLCVVNFYRCPNRHFHGDKNKAIVASADGKIVAIEEVYEKEYFKDKRILISIFMSPFNVHANWFPVNGKVLFKKHHNGRFKAAYLPKSSTENERSTVIIETLDGKNQVLLRQIAGAMARRIVTYAEVGETGDIDDHLGFIKLGSRVDVYLPLGVEILVQMNQKVTGNQTEIARFPEK